MRILLQPVSACHLKMNDIRERANRTIWEYVVELGLSDQCKSSVDLGSNATFYKNTTREHNKGSSFELLFNRAPRLSTISSPQRHGDVNENVADGRRRQMQSALLAKHRISPSASVDGKGYF